MQYKFLIINILIFVILHNSFLFSMQQNTLCVFKLGYNIPMRRFLPIALCHYDKNLQMVKMQNDENESSVAASHQDLYKFLKENNDITRHIECIERFSGDSFVVLPKNLQKGIISIFTSCDDTIDHSDILQQIKDSKHDTSYVLMIPSVAHINEEKLREWDRGSTIEKILFSSDKVVAIIVCCIMLYSYVYDLVLFKKSFCS